MSAKRIGREEIYKGKIFTVVQDEIEFEDGNRAKWDLVMHNGACAIVPLTKDLEVILVKQYRNAENGDVLEIPAGKLEKGEEPLTCAKRELEEEIGYRANSLYSCFFFKSFPILFLMDKTFLLHCNDAFLNPIFLLLVIRFNQGS